VDVLIAGTGPAGLCLAAQLARVPQIRTLVVEPGPARWKRARPTASACAMEMFQAFGFAGKISRESVWINETTFWAPGTDAPLSRVARVQDVPDGISEMPHVLINQARVHDMFLDVMRHAPTRLEPDYGLKVADLCVDPRPPTTRDRDAGTHRCPAARADPRRCGPTT
jgi:phenol 2-monooxygenase